jgi:putative ABC transport system substrate-binding protein
MRRRTFLASLAAAAAWPLAAQARIPRVGCFWNGSPEPNVAREGLRAGLSERGYILGGNLMLEERYAHEDPGQARALLAELLALDVDVLVTGSYALTLAHTLTSAVPIVGVAADFLGVGLAKALARPGGNVTGLSLLSVQFSPKWLEALKTVVPKLNRVAFLADFSGISAEEKRGLDEAAPRFGVTVTQLDAYYGNLEASLAAMAGFDGLIAGEVSEFYLPRITEAAAQSRIPAIYSFSTAVRQGGLMSYSADYFALWRGVAGYVDRILKGASPGELPIEQATQIKFAVNLKTAQTLGLEIPPTLLAAADEVIE